jgi:predicted TIM-barrel fold metal-dependent hydrolase
LWPDRRHGIHLDVFEVLVAQPLPYPVYDADNHLYESQEAMTANLPRRWRKEFCYVDTFRKHVWVSPFYEEPIDELAALIGVGHVLFGSDYPHAEGLAHPLDFTRELTAFPADEQRRIMSDNLKALLRPAQ